MTSHDTAEAMVRSLTTYMNDAHRVLSLVREEFPATRMNLHHINKQRQRHIYQADMLRRGKHASHLTDNGEYGLDGRADLAPASRALLEAIRREHPDRITAEFVM